MFKTLFSSWKVWGHGLLLAVLGAVFTALTGQHIPGLSEANMLIMVALSAAIGYLMKNVFTQGVPNGSTLFSLSLADIGYMVFQFIVTGILTAVGTTLALWQFPTLAQLGAIAWTAITNALIYLAKNYLITNSQGQILTPEPATK